VARALGLAKGGAARTPLGKWQAAPEEKAGRRPGHKRTPFVADNEALSDDEGRHGDEDHVDEEPPDAKRQRTASASDSPAAPGADPPQTLCELACIFDDAFGSRLAPALDLLEQRKVTAMCRTSE